MAHFQPSTSPKPIFVSIITKTLSITVGLAALALLAGGVFLIINPSLLRVDSNSVLSLSQFPYGIAAILVSILLGLIAKGLWQYKNWARTILLTGLILFVIYYFTTILFAVASSIFAGEASVPITSILWVMDISEKRRKFLHTDK